MLVLCLLLARWQWHRYEMRQLENARIDAVLSAPVAPLGDVIAATPAHGDPLPLDPALQWRLVTATGTFDTAAEVAVRRRPLEGKNGFWIVTPLVTDSGRRAGQPWLGPVRDGRCRDPAGSPGPLRHGDRDRPPPRG